MTSELLSDAELQAIRARCEAATPGPWRHRPEKYDDWGLIRAADDMPVIDAGCCSRVPDEYRAMPYSEERIKGPPEIFKNAEFSAHARADIPRLLDHIATLQSRIRELESKARGD